MMAREHGESSGSSDPFARTDRLDEATLEALVERFEARGEHPLFAAMLREYLEAMQIDGARRVLDMGCGSGLAARAIARREAFSGRVLGIDRSPHLVSAARRLARREGVAEQIEFRSGDVGNVDAADGSFDALVAHTLVSHVAEPLAMLEEAARLLEPGGVLGVFDGDYASLTLEHPAPVQAARHERLLIDALVTNPRIMRHMPRLLRQAGFELVASFSHVLSEAGRADFWRSAIEVYRRLLAKAGVMSETEANDWSVALAEASEQGVFFGSCNYYSYVARRS